MSSRIDGRGTQGRSSTPPSFLSPPSRDRRLTSGSQIGGRDPFDERRAQVLKQVVEKQRQKSSKGSARRGTGDHGRNVTPSSSSSSGLSSPSMELQRPQLSSHLISSSKRDLKSLGAVEPEEDTEPCSWEEPLSDPASQASDDDAELQELAQKHSGLDQGARISTPPSTPPPSPRFDKLAVYGNPDLDQLIQRTQTSSLSSSSSGKRDKRRRRKGKRSHKKSAATSPRKPGPPTPILDASGYSLGAAPSTASAAAPTLVVSPSASPSPAAGSSSSSSAACDAAFGAYADSSMALPPLTGLTNSRSEASDDENTTSSSDDVDEWKIQLPPQLSFGMASPADNEFKLENYWNATFLEVVDKIRALRHKDDAASLKERRVVIKQLLQLNEDFIHVAKVYGKIIISEVFLPDSAKTIKPLSVGGIAGGAKYLVQDILFKFAVDSHGLYGGDNISAAKVAGHELKGLLSYMGCDLPDVNFPLMALLDYRGFRLVAMSRLPLGPQSLIYGSKDGGITVYAEDDTLNRRMRYCGKKLKLAKHVSRGKKIWAAADIEGHRGTDGRYYLLDFSRTFPPVRPDPRARNGHLYQLFRREFVSSYKEPLCSDAYSGFVQEGRQQFNEQIDQATDHLLNNVIPKAGKPIMMKLYQFSKQGNLHDFDVTKVVHEHAINMRYLGMVFHSVNVALNSSAIMRSDGAQDGDDALHASSAGVMDGSRSQQIREKVQTQGLPLFIIEAVARVVKHALNRRLQEKMRELRIPREVPYLSVIVKFLNTVFSSTDVSQQWWGDVIDTLVRVFRFDPADLPSTGLGLQKLVLFPQAESDTQRGVFLSGRWLLFQRIMQMTGMVFSGESKRRFKGIGRWNPLEPLDILDLRSIGERVKFMDIVDIAEAAFFEIKGLVLERKGTTIDQLIVEEMFVNSLKKFERALNSAPHNPETLLSCGRVATKVLELRSKRLNTTFAHDEFLCNQAGGWLTKAQKIQKNNARFLLPHAQFLAMKGEVTKAEEKFLEALEKSPCNLKVLLAYGNFLISSHRPDQGRAVLALAAGSVPTDGEDADAAGDDNGEKVSMRVYLEDRTFKTVGLSASATAANVRQAVVKAIRDHLNRSFKPTERQVTQLLYYYTMFRLHECNGSGTLERVLPDDERPWITILQRPGNQSTLHLLPMVGRSIDFMADSVPLAMLPIVSDRNTFLLKVRHVFASLSADEPYTAEFEEIDLTDTYREVRQSLSDAFALQTSLKSALKKPRSVSKSIAWALGHSVEAFRLLTIAMNAVKSECSCENLCDSDTHFFPWDSNNATKKLHNLQIDVDASTYCTYFQNWVVSELRPFFFPAIQGIKLSKDSTKQATERATVLCSRMFKIYAHLVHRHSNFLSIFLFRDFLRIAYLHLYYLAIEFGFCEPKKSPELFSSMQRTIQQWSEELDRQVANTPPSPK